jgi:hypothetical protein
LHENADPNGDRELIVFEDVPAWVAHH